MITQAALYAGSGLAASVATVVATTLLARGLGTEEYSQYTLTTSLLSFLAGLAELGMFVPAARLIAQADALRRRELTGAAILVFIPIGLGFNLVVLALSSIADGVFRVHPGALLGAAVALAFAFPMDEFWQWVAQGHGRLPTYAAAKGIGQLAFIGVLLLWSVGLLVADTRHLMIAQLTSLTCAWVVLAIALRPRFRNVRAHVRAFTEGRRHFGWHIYVGRVLSVGTYRTDVLLLGVLAAPSDVGFYVLAGAIAAASSMPVTALAAVLFADFTTRVFLDRRLLVTSSILAVVCALLATVLAKPFVLFVFSERYTPVASLVGPLALAGVIRAVTTIYNSFLMAHGLGIELRRAAVVLTISNVVFNLLLIPPYGALGAAWASILALLANMAAHIDGYRRWRLKIDTAHAVT